MMREEENEQRAKGNTLTLQHVKKNLGALSA